MIGLASILTERWGLVEADFQRFYGLDLRVEVDATPHRRLWALIHGLPPDSATFRPEDGWTTRDELLASLLERVDWWARQFAVLRGVKPAKLPHAVTVPRPGQQDHRPGRVVTDPGELVAYFRKHTL